MFSFPITSLSASKLHCGHLSLLYPASSNLLEPHLGHSDDVLFGLTMASGTLCFSACQSIRFPILLYPIMVSLAM
jgi:hypothetical protein